MSRREPTILDNKHTDMPADLLLYKWTPSFFHPYFQLARLDRPTGIGLLYIPALWGAILALYEGKTPFLSHFFWSAFVLFIGSILARAIGCVWNDITDHRLDALVQRTKGRPIPSGRVSLKQAYIFALLLMVATLPIIIALPLAAITLLPGIALLIVIYPFAKRVTFWPQLLLGITFNASLFVGWLMVAQLPVYYLLETPVPWLAYLAAVLWTIGYDTIYAYQDIKDDTLAHVKSTARRFHFRKTPTVLFFATSMVMLFFMSAFINPSFLLTIALIPAWLYQTYLLIEWQPRSPSISLLTFKKQTYFGALISLGLFFYFLYSFDGVFNEQIVYAVITVHYTNSGH